MYMCRMSRFMKDIKMPLWNCSECAAHQDNVGVPLSLQSLLSAQLSTRLRISFVCVLVLSHTVPPLSFVSVLSHTLPLYPLYLETVESVGTARSEERTGLATCPRHHGAASSSAAGGTCSYLSSCRVMCANSEDLYHIYLFYFWNYLFNQKGERWDKYSRTKEQIG